MTHQPLTQRFAHRAALRSEWVYGRGYQGPGDAVVFADLAARQPLWSGIGVLEVGSGLGGDAIRLARRYGANVLGIDASPDMTELARQRAAEAGTDTVAFCTADVRGFRPQGDAFDLVWSRDCFMYLPADEKAAAWTALLPALRPGGRVLVTDYGRGAPLCSAHFEHLHEDSEYNLITAEEQAEILGAAGFHAVRVEDATPVLLASMRRERAHLTADASEFLARFTPAEHADMVRRWDRKIAVAERHELTWQVVTAVRPC